MQTDRIKSDNNNIEAFFQAATGISKAESFELPAARGTTREHVNKSCIYEFERDIRTIEPLLFGAVIVSVNYPRN